MEIGSPTGWNLCCFILHLEQHSVCHASYWCLDNVRHWEDIPHECNWPIPVANHFLHKPIFSYKLQVRLNKWIWMFLHLFKMNYICWSRFTGEILFGLMLLSYTIFKVPGWCEKLKNFIKSRNNPINIPTVSSTIPMEDLQQRPLQMPDWSNPQPSTSKCAVPIPTSNLIQWGKLKHVPNWFCLFLSNCFILGLL